MPPDVEEGVANHKSPLMRKTTRAYNAIVAAHHHDTYSDVDAAAMFAADLLWSCVWEDLAEMQPTPRSVPKRSPSAKLRALALSAAMVTSNERR
jgi:hypothetical protein